LNMHENILVTQLQNPTAEETVPKMPSADQ
jgi:hypothetical protein